MNRIGTSRLSDAGEGSVARRVGLRLGGGAVGGRLAVGIALAAVFAVIGCAGQPGDGQPGGQSAGQQGVQGSPAAASGGAAQRIEETRMATGTAKIVRDGERVYIDGFQKDAYHMRNSIIATISGAMTAMGEDCSYDYLMGISGTAFRTQFMYTNGCPSSACAPCGYNTMNVALEALGYDATSYATDNNPAVQEQARRAVVAAVDRGRPALLASEETGLLVGYAKGGGELLCREYFTVGKPDGYTPMEKWPWFVMVFGEKRAAKDRAALVRESLGRAVALYNAPDMPEPNQYAEGVKAYRLWIDLLEDDARVGKLDKDQLFGACQANAYCYYCLMDARAAAAKYFRSIAPQFKPEASASLARAAGAYEQIAQAIKKGREGLPGLFDLYPWKLDRGKGWTIAMRRIEAGILKDCLKLEEQALAELSKAAQIEGIPLPAIRNDAKPRVVEIGGDANGQPATAPAVVPSARAVVLKDVVASFERTIKDAGNLNHSRTDLVMRLMFLRAAGIEDVSYGDLVVLSGYGTSFGYHPKTFQVMYITPDGTEETEARLARGTGLAWEYPPKVKDAEEAWKIVTAAVGKGRGVQATWYDDYVFAGVDDSPVPAERKVYVLGGWNEKPEWWTWDKFSQWCTNFGRLGTPGERVSRASPKESALAIMKRTAAYVDRDGRAERPWAAEGKYGLAGLEAYAADVADANKDPNYFNPGWLGCHAIYRQITGRPLAAAYLRKAAKEFRAGVASHMQEAAKEYDAAWADWREWEKHLGQADGRTESEAIKKVWADPAARAAGAKAIRSAIVHERAAVAEVSKAASAAE